MPWTDADYAALGMTPPGKSAPAKPDPKMVARAERAKQFEDSQKPAGARAQVRDALKRRMGEEY